MKTISVNDFLQDTDDDIIKEIVVTSEPVTITSDTGNIVLISKSEWDRIQKIINQREG